MREAGLRRRKQHITRFPIDIGKLTHFVAAPFPNETASLGFAGDPIFSNFTATPTKQSKEKAIPFGMTFSFLVREAGLEPARPQ